MNGPLVWKPTRQDPLTLTAYDGAFEVGYIFRFLVDKWYGRLTSRRVTFGRALTRGAAMARVLSLYRGVQEKLEAAA